VYLSNGEVRKQINDVPFLQKSIAKLGENALAHIEVWKKWRKICWIMVFRLKDLSKFKKITKSRVTIRSFVSRTKSHLEGHNKKDILLADCRVYKSNTKGLRIEQRNDEWVPITRVTSSPYEIKKFPVANGVHYSSRDVMLSTVQPVWCRKFQNLTVSRFFRYSPIVTVDWKMYKKRPRAVNNLLQVFQHWNKYS